MPVGPPVYVTRQTAPDAPRFGLLSVASMPTDGGDRAVYNGIEYDLPPEPKATGSPTDCVDTPADPIDLDRGHPTTTAMPIRAWSGFECSTVGLDDAEIASYARAKLTAAESPYLEAELWSEADPSLMSADTVVIEDTAVPLEVGIGLLEGWLHTSYAGVGALHIPRALGALADHKSVLHASGSKLATLVGTPAALGNYPTTGPAGQAAAAGTYWIVASGDVVARRGEIKVHTTQPAARLDWRRNNIQGIAERSYVVSFDDVAAAVLVNLT
ncbi:hypothetical protein SEA_PHLOP_20 [Gordonia phage Phlop]|uniref:Uncharacterized protein n=1 Tax=Gordonia phage Phlop TaxID=2805836 RepID=A0A890UN16_9CAUD|nr:hypothetical protein KNV78_gp20 [Gordonia phage Phlop]QRI44983.1 hypothetical protein SEA_PHLOP_20 [Gordonia phage Phlop]UVK63732.1 hypothetical protein SEA_PULLUMCAVEA_20 [Gordonia phage PullumCavea]